jgi:hypothetical protein
MGRVKLVPRVFEEGQVIIFKRIGTYKGYDVIFILEKTTDTKGGTRYTHLEISVGKAGGVYQHKYNYAESTFRQRVRGFSNKTSYQEVDKDGAKLEMVVSVGKSLSMVLREAITRSENNIQYKIDWYSKRIGKETKQLATLEKAKAYIE